MIIFPPFSSCINIFLGYFSFINNCISHCYLCHCCSLVFLLSFSSDSIYWHVQVCRSNEILVRLYLLYARSCFPCVRIYRKLYRYPCIGTLLRGIFHLLLKFLDLIVCPFSQISSKYCHRSSQYLKGDICYIFHLLVFSRWFLILRVS